MLQPLLGQWDREGVVGEGEEMNLVQGRELRPCHGPGAESRTGSSVCTESVGNGEDESPGKKWAMGSCKSV